MYESCMIMTHNKIDNNILESVDLSRVSIYSIDQKWVYTYIFNLHAFLQHNVHIFNIIKRSITKGRSTTHCRYLNFDQLVINCPSTFCFVNSTNRLGTNSSRKWLLKFKNCCFFVNLLCWIMRRAAGVGAIKNRNLAQVMVNYLTNKLIKIEVTAFVTIYTYVRFRIGYFGH